LKLGLAKAHPAAEFSVPAWVMLRKAALQAVEQALAQIPESYGEVCRSARHELTSHTRNPYARITFLNQSRAHASIRPQINKESTDIFIKSKSALPGQTTLTRGAIGVKDH
jgi:hypothetical protein